MINLGNIPGVGTGGDDAAAIQAAHNSSPAVFYPAGTYRIGSSIILPSSSMVLGEGCLAGGHTGTSGTGSVVQATTSAPAYIHTAPLGQYTRGPIFEDMTILAQNGVQINNPGLVGNVTAKPTDAPIFKRTAIVQNGTLGTGYGIQACVVSHIGIEDKCDILGFSNGIDLQDVYAPSCIRDSRISYFGNAAIKLSSPNTGALLTIEGNDLLAGFSGSIGFITVFYDRVRIRDNYMEQYSSQGTGLTAAIVVTGSADLVVEDNFIIISTACAPHWISVGSTAVAKIHRNNVEGSAGSLLFTGSLPPILYYGSNILNGAEVLIGKKGFQ